MANESEMIQQQMEETRSSLQDKLETLEEQVKNTVQGATDAVSDTVETVKDAVQDTVETVKDTVEETVQSVKDTFDVPRQVESHPWPMFFGAVAIGFVATRWLARTAEPTSPKIEKHDAKRHGSRHNGKHHAGNGSSAASRMQASQPALATTSENSFASHYANEIGKIKGLAIGTLGAMVRDMLTTSAPPPVADQLKEIVNGFTTKLGGQVIEGQILSPSAPEPAEEPQETGQHARFRV